MDNDNFSKHIDSQRSHNNNSNDLNGSAVSTEAEPLDDIPYIKVEGMDLAYAAVEEEGSKIVELPPPPIRTDIVEVQFKGNRRQPYFNGQKINFHCSDLVVVEADNGYDVGTIAHCGINLHKDENEEEQKKLKKVVRKANEEDKKRYDKNLNEESQIVGKTKELVNKYKLDMKVTDAEWQFDRQRLTIYFTAPQRIDFRELVKDLARQFKTRIELRQISTREETKRLGTGIGCCGLSLCCTSFMKDFNHVTLDHARTQQLSNNVAKLSGYCGRLKCCLLFEYDSYTEAFEKYPPLDAIVDMKEGNARILKVDIFKDIIYMHIKKSNQYVSLSLDELNKYKEDGKVTIPERIQQEYDFDNKNAVLDE